MTSEYGKRAGIPLVFYNGNLLNFEVFRINNVDGSFFADHQVFYSPDNSRRDYEIEEDIESVSKNLNTFNTIEFVDFCLRNHAVATRYLRPGRSEIKYNLDEHPTSVELTAFDNGASYLSFGTTTGNLATFGYNTDGVLRTVTTGRDSERLDDENEIFTEIDAIEDAKEIIESLPIAEFEISEHIRFYKNPHFLNIGDCDLEVRPPFQKGINYRDTMFTFGIDKNLLKFVISIRRPSGVNKLISCPLLFDYAIQSTAKDSNSFDWTNFEFIKSFKVKIDNGEDN